MSHGNVARNRYKRINHSDEFDVVDGGRTTGHQKRSPVTKNDACSTPCHIPDCSPSIKTGGMCHMTSVPAAASQQTAGCAIALLSRCTDAELNHELITPTDRCGKPFSSTFTGAPSQIKGGA